MKKINMDRFFTIIALVIALVAFGRSAQVAHAQAITSTTPLQLQLSGVHTSCLISPGVTSLCGASDGLYISTSGGAWVGPLGVAGAAASFTVDSLPVTGFQSGTNVTFKISNGIAIPNAKLTTISAISGATIQ